MNRNPASFALSCLVSACLFSLPAGASTSQQPVDKGATESVAKTTGKTSGKPTKPSSSKTVSRPGTGTSASPKKGATTTAKAGDKPGKRFWSRIMGVFRDVHSVEKKPNK